MHDVPLGAIHVNSLGMVLEHRPIQTGERVARTRPITGRHVGSIAPWAREQAFVAALASALNSSNASFHFDFIRAASPSERMIHVNILSVGDKTVWIFISDKTLAMISA